jgi:hypothetical protein
MMILGINLLIWRPVYLQPPFFRYTHVIYAVFACLWFPVLIFLLSQNPGGKRLLPMLLVIVCTPIAVCTATLLLMSTLWALGNGQDCIEQSSNPTSIEYVCDVSIFADAQAFQTFDAPACSLIMIPKKIQ